MSAKPASGDSPEGRERGRVLLSPLFEVVAGASLAVGILGITRQGADVWLGVFLIVAFALLSLRDQYAGASAIRMIGVRLRHLLIRSGRSQSEMASRLLRYGIHPAAEIGWIGLMLAAAACVVIVLVHASQPIPRLASALDGLDPVQTQCAGKGALDVPGVPPAPIRDPRGNTIGMLHLVESLYCGTRWARVVIAPRAARQFKGRSLEIVATRPADDALAPYNLPLRGGRFGYGDMLAASGACVLVSARLLPTATQAAGPTAQTHCA